jgi:hypothetical protein
MAIHCRIGNYSTLATAAMIVTGVPLGMYVYKCLMMTLFQRRIIYVSYLPLGARQPEDPTELCHNLEVHPILLRSRDHTRLQGYLFGPASNVKTNPNPHATSRSVSPVLIYFQG